MQALNDRDLVDEIVSERARRNPAFPDLVRAASSTRDLIHRLTVRRQELELSQTLVAARMGTSQSALARIESGESDPRISTIARYAMAVHLELELQARDDPRDIGADLGTLAEA